MQTTVVTPAKLRISKVGLGCVTFGREIDESAAHAMLDHAFARGIIFLDTASAYAAGESERIIGRWLALRRPADGSITLATKVLPPYDPGRLGDVVEGSLERLGVSRIDVLYFHRWDRTAESPEVLAALDTLVDTGKVGAVGACNYNGQQLGTALTLQQEHLARFSVLQNNQNLAVSDIGAELRRYCAEHGVAIVTYSPLGAGFLTGKHQRGVQPGSRFDLVPGHQDVYFHDEAWRRLARLESVATRTGQTQAHLALAWALHQPGVASVLVGGRTPAHIDQALAAYGFDDSALFAELESVAGTANTSSRNHR